MAGEYSKIATDIGEAWAWILATLSGTLVWASHMRRKLKSDNREATNDEAHTSVVQLLRQEVERLAEQNRKLAFVVEELQTEIIQLRSENARLLRAYNAAVGQEKKDA